MSEMFAPSQFGLGDLSLKQTGRGPIKFYISIPGFTFSYQLSPGSRPYPSNHLKTLDWPGCKELSVPLDSIALLFRLV